MKKRISKAFFDRPTLRVARELLGKCLVRRVRGRELVLVITEVEAYDGPRDLASHASRGRTPRTTIMFGEAGRFYAYFTYGMHWLVNVVTGPKDYPAAVLLRGGVLISDAASPKVIKGPARLTKALRIDGALNQKRATPESGLWFEDRGITVRKNAITATKRIGVDYAGPVWASKEYNFSVSPQALSITDIARAYAAAPDNTSVRTRSGGTSR